MSYGCVHAHVYVLYECMYALGVADCAQVCFHVHIAIFPIFSLESWEISKSNTANITY